MNIPLRRKLNETSEICQLSEEVIRRFISSDWIHPIDQEHFMFDDEDIARILLVQDLEERLGVNKEGIDIILHLIDHINRLHLEIRKGL